MNASAQSNLRRTDHRFYVWAWTAAFAIVFAGFARSYFLREMSGRAPLAPLLHLHGAVMTAWFVLFFVQTRLIATRHTDLHRKLGVSGATLAALIVVVGTCVLVRAAARHAHGTHTALFIELLVAFDGVNLLVFASLVASAIALRRRGDFHKRLILLSTLSLLPPAIGRIWEYFAPHGSELAILLLMYMCVLACVLVDSFRHRHLHPAFGWGAALVIASIQITYLAQVST